MNKRAAMFIWHTREIDGVESDNSSATAIEAHAAESDTKAETVEIKTKIPTKTGPIKVKILPCRSIAAGVDINLFLMISGSCCFIK